MGKTTEPPPETIAAAFRLALAAARDFAGATSPNPPVGCAVLDASGQVLALAAHQKAGHGHAEALALAQCRERGVLDLIHTLVVTLEPCNHSGRTPPCAEAILASPAKTVWIGATDPNPRVAGGGMLRLQAAGLTVGMIGDLDAGLASQARRLVAPFAKHATAGLPFVTVKQALDATGSMIPPPGSKTFTSPSSLTLAHQLRRRADAVLTGSGTILADAPLFTVRHVPDFPGKTRHLVILDHRKRVSEAYLASARACGFITQIATSLPEVLDRLGQLGALEVLVEAGPALTQSVLQGPHWDEHVLIRAGADGTDHVQVLPRSPIFPTPERT